MQVEYLRDETERRRAAPVDMSSVFDVETLPIEEILPPQASEPTAIKAKEKGRDIIGEKGAKNMKKAKDSKG
uniref:Uncharacterized protein n=1 Tax=Solanum tuberosum TaxID=4113 RepID=M1DQE2_SOLTU